MTVTVVENDSHGIRENSANQSWRIVMTDQLEVLQRFNAALPAIGQWIEDTLSTHESDAIPISELGFLGLANHFSQEFLGRSRAVVTSRPPVPPLTQLGLPELSDFETMPLAGITYKDTFFVHESHRTESLHFHELVHVVQWDRLGVNRFLWAYGVGLIQFGYKDNPLEQIAYILQSNFDKGVVPDDPTTIIHERADLFWSQVSLILQHAGIEEPT